MPWSPEAPLRAGLSPHRWPSSASLARPGQLRRSWGLPAGRRPWRRAALAEAAAAAAEAGAGAADGGPTSSTSSICCWTRRAAMPPHAGEWRRAPMLVRSRACRRRMRLHGAKQEALSEGGKPRGGVDGFSEGAVHPLVQHLVPLRQRRRRHRQGGRRVAAGAGRMENRCWIWSSTLFGSDTSAGVKAVTWEEALELYKDMVVDCNFEDMCVQLYYCRSRGFCMVIWVVVFVPVACLRVCASRALYFTVVEILY